TGAGARSAGNPHAACDAAGTGDGITVAPTRARRGKPRLQPRSGLRITAPVPDPTAAAAAGITRNAPTSTPTIRARRKPATPGILYDSDGDPASDVIYNLLWLIPTWLRATGRRALRTRWPRWWQLQLPSTSRGYHSRSTTALDTCWTCSNPRRCGRRCRRASTRMDTCGHSG